MLVQVYHGLHSQKVERFILDNLHVLFLLVLPFVLLLRHVLDHYLIFNVQVILLKLVLQVAKCVLFLCFFDIENFILREESDLLSSTFL